MAFNEARESASTILVSTKQTRFHLLDPVYQELDIEGLNLTVTSANIHNKTALRAKGKARGEGLELLNSAILKLKPGVHYGLIGRNGSGKSTILRAISEKLIPGIPLKTRIAILQQTKGRAADPSNDSYPSASREQNAVRSVSERSVIEEVVENALSRDSVQQELDILLPAINDTEDIYASVRALRALEHGRLKREHFWLDKDASLRSGTRGLEARKTLTAFEKRLEESASRLDVKDSEIDDSELKEESEAALELLAELQAQVEPARISEVETKARSILTGLGFPGTDYGKKVSSLSGGWRMRCDLASALLQESDILILDEPTNFLDLLGILWLEKHLLDLQTSSKTTVLIVSHDRVFVDSCQEIILLRDKSLTYFHGNLSSYEEDQRKQKLYLGRMQEAQDRQKSHIEQTIQRNIKQGKATGDDNKLRQAKSRQKKLDDRMGLQVSAKGGRFKLNRDLAGFHLTSRAEIDIPAEERGVSILIPRAPDLRFPGPLISLEGITLKYKSAAKATLQDVNLVIHVGDRIGILGLNGSGKSTLIKLITETIKPSKGTVTRHARLRLGYYSQHAVEELQALGHSDPALTALSLLTADVAGELDEGDVRGLLGSLGLPGRTASDVPLAKLSGGQLVRLALAKLLWPRPQLLVLDEITTHLDFHTVTALSQALARWNGAILLVSHDRYLIRRVIEGEKPQARDDVAAEDNGEDEDDDDDDDDVGLGRRREVFVLKGGRLVAQGPSGVGAFEQSLERRVAKLLIS
ncbi:MAG: hypothetical protein M1818_001706 [Claussenomyces sp. TS43310]|nr:MAG: hypothetical protein M1818_001706 [Claussenomyces sp. TS43310]